MDQKMRKQLKEIYEAPKPAGKRAFFRKTELPPLNIGSILWMQCFYITKWEWIASVILLGTAVVIGSFYREWVFRTVLAMLPFLAVVGVSESVRSITWGMSELEMSARFSLKSVVLARMVIVGIANVVLEMILALLAGGNLLETVLYLFVPYLLTAYGSLILVRTISGKDGIYACAGLGVFVSMVTEFSILQYSWIYQTRYAGFWFVVVCFIMYLMIREGKRDIRKMEELVWN
ncbi:MAG: hypothetical protein K2J90_02005 [Lachnospiraceae bacterium]|nr:hypothetical protein [Lachnospiraceae bacterium]